MRKKLDLTEVQSIEMSPKANLGWTKHFNEFQAVHNYYKTNNLKPTDGHPWKLKYSTPDYHMYHHNAGGDHRYLAVDKDHKPILGVNMAHTPGKFGVIDTLASNKENKSSIKAHHIYHDMMHHGVVKGLVTDNQSEGGMKVWQKLNRMRDINIHGWDEDEGKPVNTGRVFRPDETHVGYDEYTDHFMKFSKDRTEVSDKLEKVKDDSTKKKLAKDLMGVDADHGDLKTQRDMKLVAHLKAAKKKRLHEARSLPDVAKYEKFGWQSSFDRFAETGMKDRERGHWTVKHESEDYKILHRKRKDTGYKEYHEFMAVDKNNKPIVGVNGKPTRGKFLDISTLASNTENREHPLKAHHFYHDLMHHDLVKGFVTHSQSEGGTKVWQKLNKIRGVNIHGWDGEAGKPVNLGKVFRPDETHVTRDDHGHEWDKHYWDMEQVKNDDPNKNKIVNQHMDDIEDNAKRYRMKLVAHLKKKPLKEDAPTNSAGAGAVAGLGIGPQGDAVGRPFKRGKFGKHETFMVNPHTFLKARTEKRKGAHWRKYLEEDENYNDIREYAFKKPKSPIILQCERTGAMCFARFGREP